MLPRETKLGKDTETAAPSDRAHRGAAAEYHSQRELRDGNRMRAGWTGGTGHTGASETRNLSRCFPACDGKPLGG